MNYWLMKSEPDAFGIEDLKAMPDQTDHWDGVRNYQARNMMRDRMKLGDQVFFYHSNCKQPGIVGIMEVTREGYPDHTAWDPEQKYYDPKSDPEQPRWFMVDVRYLRDLERLIGLQELKAHAKAAEASQSEVLADFPLVRRGNRLSIMPVTKAQWDFVLHLEQGAGPS